MWLLCLAPFQKDSRVSLTATLAQSDYCSTRNLDPQDALCAHVILTGQMAKVINSYY